MRSRRNGTAVTSCVGEADRRGNIAVMLLFGAVVCVSACAKTKPSHSVSVLNRYGADLVDVIVTVNGREHHYPTLQNGERVWISPTMSDGENLKFSLRHSKGNEGWRMIEHVTEAEVVHLVTIMELVEDADPHVFKER